MRLDARIPVHLVSPDRVPDPAPDDAVLIRIGAAARAPQPQDPSGWAAIRSLPDAAIEAHEAGCGCCSGRSGLADALGLLFAQRARMELPFFRRVVLQAEPDRFHTALTILRQDALVSGRFRPETEK